MKFLDKCITDIRDKHQNLSDVRIILPGKRPVVFIKKILKEKKYSGFLPEFFTIEDLVSSLANVQEIKGIALWLYGFEVYRKIFPSESFSEFLKWFPTLLKDWDDILKFSDSETKVLDYMLAEERIKNWGESLGDSPRKKNLDFWRRMNVFIPKLKSSLQENNLATSGMISELAKCNIEDFAKNTKYHYAFLGFNAFTKLEEKLIRSLLQWDKADCYFQADEYYINDTKQEAGKFLREHLLWKEFNNNRNFKWIDNDFEKQKNIRVFEVSGNVSQTKILPDILSDYLDFTNTAVVLLDENLLPATLEALGNIGELNITMGFPLKNLSFSNAVKQVFYLQKQFVKKSGSYYYKDLLAILEEMPKNINDIAILDAFQREIEEFNIVYLSLKRVRDLLSELSFFQLLVKKSSKEILNIWIDFCAELKFRDLNDDVLYESISAFEKNFKIIKNQIEPYDFDIQMDTLEVLIQQLINSESIDFQGEPLAGLQVMGLLETRLLNFKNIIMISVNEGKLPLGNSQNTYLPFDVRKQFDLNTFIENDSIYAYHFYRFLQDSENINLIFNALSSGVNVGEKSRFITQIEMESTHKIEHIIIENPAEPTELSLMTFEKNAKVLEKLEIWKNRVAVSNLNTYLYNPIDFYFSKILKTKEIEEVEEELSDRNYGNLIHYSLQNLYKSYIGKKLCTDDISSMLSIKNQAIENAIIELKHQPEFYQTGMNFIHKAIASKVIEDILNYDLNLVKSGHQLEIVAVEMKFEDIDFELDDELKNQVKLYGFIDRIDKLDGVLRIIDYKTAKAKDLTISLKEENKTTFFFNTDKKQAMQLCVYQYVIKQLAGFKNETIETGIWSFAEVGLGVQSLVYKTGDLDDALCSVRQLIKEILNPEIPFVEKVHFTND